MALLHFFLYGLSEGLWYKGVISTFRGRGKGFLDHFELIRLHDPLLSCSLQILIVLTI